MMFIHKITLAQIEMPLIQLLGLKSSMPSEITYKCKTNEKLAYQNLMKFLFTANGRQNKLPI